MGFEKRNNIASNNGQANFGGGGFGSGATGGGGPGAANTFEGLDGTGAASSSSGAPGGGSRRGGGLGGGSGSGGSGGGAGDVAGGEGGSDLDLQTSDGGFFSAGKGGGGAGGSGGGRGIGAYRSNFLKSKLASAKSDQEKKALMEAFKNGALAPKNLRGLASSGAKGLAGPAQDSFSTIRNTYKKKQKTLYRTRSK